MWPAGAWAGVREKGSAERERETETETTGQRALLLAGKLKTRGVRLMRVRHRYGAGGRSAKQRRTGPHRTARTAPRRDTPMWQREAHRKRPRPAAGGGGGGRASWCVRASGERRESEAEEEVATRRQTRPGRKCREAEAARQVGRKREAAGDSRTPRECSSPRRCPLAPQNPCRNRGGKRSWKSERPAVLHVPTHTHTYTHTHTHTHTHIRAKAHALSL